MASQHPVMKSPYQLDIPPIDIATFVFRGVDEAARAQPQYFNADRPEQNFSLQEAELLVKRVALGLQQQVGLRPNDKVLLYSGNSLYFPVLFWATVAARCVFSGCSPSASVSELSYQLKDSDAKILLSSEAGLPTAMKAARECGLSQDRIYVFSERNPDNKNRTLRYWNDFWASEKAASAWSWHTFAGVEEAMSTTAVINYSSGTTGVPKGVEITHYNIVSNCLQVIFKRNMVADTAIGRQRQARVRLSGERWLAPLPMFHAYGQAYYCCTAARMGVKVYIMYSYSIERYMLYLDAYRITFLTGVPTLMVQLSKHPKATHYNLKAIESVVTGSAPLNPDIGRLVEKTHLREGVQVKQGWGMTETTCSATGFAQDDLDDGRSIGWLNPNVSAKIVPSDDHEFQPSEEIPYTIGEIWVAGPNIMRGYYKRPEETVKTLIPDEAGRVWLRTGDVGYVDNRGCFYIVDRMKELIKVKGLQVAPAEIEQVLLTNPAIADAAVVGEKRSDGEYPKAFVVKAVGANINATEVQRYIEERLSRHKWLTAGVGFLDAIPRTPSGKVIRRALQGMRPAGSDQASSSKL